VKFSLYNPVQSRMKDDCLALLRNREREALPHPDVLERILLRDDSVNDIYEDDTEEDVERKTNGRKLFQQMFDFYVEKLLMNVAGHHMWGYNAKYFEEVSKSLIPNTKLPRITASTEAFAILCYKNCWKKWNQHHRDEQAHIKSGAKGKFECPRWNRKRPDENLGYKPQYTDSAAAGQKKLGGWSREGLKEYNRLKHALLEERQKPGSAERFSREERACLLRLVLKRKIGDKKTTKNKNILYDEDDDFENNWIQEDNY